MSTIVRLVQGSPEWHEHRRTHRNASETPIVLGVSPWQTPYELWQQKLGRTVPEVTPAMLHGTQLEPAARAAYERQTGLVMQPLVMVDGEYSASLDGLTLAGDRIVELKCPLKGRDSTLWKTIAAGRLPEYYQLPGAAPADGVQGRHRQRVRLRRHRGHRVSARAGPEQLAADPRGMGQLHALRH